jgi:hypothetical protein
VATAKQPKSRKSAASKSKTKRTAAAKSSRAKAGTAKSRAGKTRRGKSLARSAAARRSAATKSARAKKSTARKPAPKRAPARKAPAKARPVARRAAAPRRAAPRPAPVTAPAPAPATDVIPPLATAVPAVAPPAAPAAASSPSAGGGEADDEDGPSRLAGIREAVASFATQALFREAVKRLRAAGFAPADLSVLASHESLAAAGIPDGSDAGGVAGLTEEANFLGPLQIAGFSALSGGPVAAAVAALVTAGLGSIALRDVIAHFVAQRHGSDYADALKAGAVLLWVRLRDPSREVSALDILGACGGRDPHINTRAA